MTHHLTDKQLIGYIHHTLTDADREAIDSHLTDCSTCRASLDENEALQRRVRNELFADLQNARPSPEMSFATIAPHINRKRKLIMVAKKSNQVLYGAATLVILLALGVGLTMLFREINQSATIPEVSVDEETAPLEETPAQVEQPTEPPADLPPMELTPGESTPSPGALKWQIKVEGFLDTGPAIADGIVYFGGNAGHLYAADAQTGQTVWATEIGSPIAALAAADGMVFAGSRDKQIYGVNSQTGQIEWEFDAGNLDQALAVEDGTLYVGSTNLHAVDAKTGQELWQFDTDKRIFPPPIINNGVVYAATNEGTLYAVDAQTGQELWQFNSEDPMRYGSLSQVVDGTIYIGTASYVYAVDIDSGQPKWHFEASHQQPDVGIGDDGIVYVGSGGQLFALDSQTGEDLWQIKTDGLEALPFPEAGGIVYINDYFLHQLFVLDGQTSQELWRFEANQSTTDPAIADDVVYFGDEAGYLYAVWAGRPAK